MRLPMNKELKKAGICTLYFNDEFVEYKRFHCPAERNKVFKYFKDRISRITRNHIYYITVVYENR